MEILNFANASDDVDTPGLLGQSDGVVAAAPIRTPAELPARTWLCPGIRALLLAALSITAIEGGVWLLVPFQAPRELGERLQAAGRPATFDETILQTQLDRLDQLEDPIDLLLLGDSSALTGLIPREIEAYTGLRTENFGTLAPLSGEGQIDLLERYLRRFPPPRAVVYHFSTISLSASTAEIERIGLLRTWRAWLGQDDRLVAAWPSYRLRPLARLLSGGHWYRSHPEEEAMRSFLLKHHGYFRDEHAPPDWARLPELAIPLHPDQLASLGRLFQLTAPRATPTFLVLGPQPEPLATPAARRGHAQNQELLARLTTLAPHVRVADPYLRTLPGPLFATRDHPTLQGALLNSRFVGDLVRRELGR